MSDVESTDLYVCHKFYKTIKRGILEKQLHFVSFSFTSTKLAAPAL